MGAAEYLIAVGVQTAGGIISTIRVTLVIIPTLKEVRPQTIGGGEMAKYFTLPFMMGMVLFLFYGFIEWIFSLFALGVGVPVLGVICLPVVLFLMKFVDRYPRY